MTVIAAFLIFATAALALFVVYHSVPALANAFSSNDRPALLRTSVTVLGAISYLLICLLVASWYAGEI
jgi:predicted Abi (CAAX) family protease